MDKHYPIETPDPIEGIKIRMEEMQLMQVYLLTGNINFVSEKDYFCAYLHLTSYICLELF